MCCAQSILYALKKEIRYISLELQGSICLPITTSHSIFEYYKATQPHSLHYSYQVHNQAAHPFNMSTFIIQIQPNAPSPLVGTIDVIVSRQELTFAKPSDLLPTSPYEHRFGPDTPSPEVRSFGLKSQPKADDT